MTLPASDLGKQKHSLPIQSTIDVEPSGSLIVAPPTHASLAMNTVSQGSDRASAPGSRPDAPAGSDRAVTEPSFTVSLIERDEDLQKLLPDWWGLWSRVPSATPFASPAWLLPWWRTFRPGTLQSIAVRQHGRLVGLSLGYIEDGAWGRRLLPLGIGVSDYLDVLVDPAVEAVGEVLVRETLSLSDRWDSWELEELMPEAAGLSLPFRTDEADPRPQSACPILPLPPLTHWPATAAHRRWRRSRNRLRRHEHVEVVEATTANVHDLLDALVTTHGRRWAAAGEGGVLADPATRAFHREAAPRLLDAGLLQLFALRVGDRTVGAYYGLLHRHRAFGYLSGYDPDWRFESPGAALLGHAIRQAVVQGCTEYHFLRGRERYKYAWGASDRWNRARTIRSAATTEDVRRGA